MLLSFIKALSSIFYSLIYQVISEQGSYLLLYVEAYCLQNQVRSYIYFSKFDSFFSFYGLPL